MKNKNEIKKVLYKEKPIANLNIEYSDGSRLYDTTCSLGRIKFKIPKNEIENLTEKEEAQLLIRWLDER